MAADSIAENIIQNVVTTLSSISSMTTVSRIRPFFNEKEYFDLDSTNLPLCAVVGQLPKPEAKASNRHHAVVDYFTSTLDVGVTTYAMATENPDKEMYNLCDDIWVGILKDLTRGKLALFTEILPEMEKRLVHPHIVFHMVVQVTYQHDITSI